MFILFALNYRSNNTVLAVKRNVYFKCVFRHGFVSFVFFLRMKSKYTIRTDKNITKSTRLYHVKLLSLYVRDNTVRKFFAQHCLSVFEGGGCARIRMCFSTMSFLLHFYHSPEFHLSIFNLFFVSVWFKHLLQKSD